MSRRTDFDTGLPSLTYTGLHDGGAGNVYILAGSGEDIVFGGADNDSITGLHGNDVLSAWLSKKRHLHRLHDQSRSHVPVSSMVDLPVPLRFFGVRSGCDAVRRCTAS